MKLALLADVHANLEALRACLAAARAQGAERLAFLGDIVGYGADPGPVLDAVAALVRDGALAVRGNHDEAVVEGDVALMHRAAGKVVAWTRERLDEAQRAFLAGLPLVVREEGLYLVHGSPEAPAAWIYVTDPLRAEQALAASEPDPWILCGHVHEPVLYTHGAARPVPFRPVPGVAIPVPPRRRWLAVVGSAGQPRDGNTAACYAMLDTRAATLTFHRVPYDWPSAVAKIRAAGLPESLARRLERGG
jgi:diadenosine tetraphosphatase ApaH/serine/threonine PP2A family protein phosphatase